MRILKIVLSVTLTAAVLLVCGGLPTLAALIQDSAIGQTQQSSLAPIHLELGSEEKPETEPSMDILEKLAILQSSYIFPMKSESMIMSEEQVHKEAMAALVPYMAMGVIQDVEYSVHSEAVIAMSSDNLGSYVTLWSVILFHEEDPYENILLHLDDQTGKVLLLQYEGYTRIFDKEVQGALLEEITSIFLDDLELSEALEELEDPQTHIELVDISDKSTAVSCTIDTAEYGSMLIEIYMTENTFNTAYPTSPD